jgi:hypothetical protein
MHPPTRCRDCSAAASVAVMIHGRGAFKGATGLFPQCDEHARGHRESVIAWVADGRWTTTMPPRPT